MDPNEFYVLAVELAKTGRAAALRSATSRAYYAVYNVVVDALDAIVPISRGPQAHKEIQRLLLATQEHLLIQVGSDLGDLHSRRCDADYRLDRKEPENPKTVEATLIEARQMIDTLHHVFTSATALQVKRRVQKFWIDVERRQLQGGKPV